MSVEINDKEVRALLTRLEGLGRGGLNHALKNIGETMLLSVQDNFAKQGRPQKWAGLSMMTRRMRKAVGKWGDINNPLDGNILQQTGKLLHSINYRLLPDGVSIGTADVRAPLLHGGGINEKGFKVPARPFIMFQEPIDVEKVKNIIQAEITKVL